ncbi:MAG: exopolysaccharide biosynthesis polyprenyl glycosylphosphotransferase [Lachnospiraceae bacterium]|nr:exopolysaccharide biosynthesis polyprenyl glycosylphosphotransferase [Lachnospiraceae bacterium]
MKNSPSLKRAITLLLTGISVLIEWLWYEHYWFTELFPRWVKESLNFYSRGHIIVLGVYGALILGFCFTYGATKLNYYKSSEIVVSIIFATVITNLITYAQISLMCMKPLPAYRFLVMTAYQIICSSAWVIIMQLILSKLFRPRKLLLVSAERPIEDILKKFGSRKDKYTITKSMNISEGMEAIKAEILEPGKYDGIIIWDVPASPRNNLLKFCYGKKIRIYTMPKISDVILRGSEQLHLFDTPVLLTREYDLKIEQRFMKRAIDLIIAFIALIPGIPIMILTALAVKLYDGGPILYKQIRCTKDMREFKILKFRSMRIDAEKDGVARLASKGDSRITPVGKVIRAIRFDELPQLFNIIKGDMSFIGPRPERPEIIAQYLETMPEFILRTRVRAGLAGYAQVYGKYNTTPYDKLKLDLFYIDNYSVLLDLRLLLLTLKILATPDSTEGIESNQITAEKNYDEGQ